MMRSPCVKVGAKDTTTMTKPAATTKPDRAVSSASNAQPVSQSSAVPQVPADMPVIKVTQGQVGGVTCLVVDARDLHTALGVKRDFTNWLKNRIGDYDFANGKDYEQTDSPNLANQDSNHGGDRKSKKYTLTLSMAKELAMVEKNVMGRAVRRYFIQCERDLLLLSEQSTATEQSQAKPIPVAPEQNSVFLDWNGLPYEKSSDQRHAMRLVQLFADIARKKTYAEHERSLTIVGHKKKELAEEFAECFYKKVFSQAIKIFLEKKVPINDLHIVKEYIEKEINK